MSKSEIAKGASDWVDYFRSIDGARFAKPASATALTPLTRELCAAASYSGVVYPKSGESGGAFKMRPPAEKTALFPRRTYG